MATRMLQRRGTAAEWAAENPILADGEMGFEKDTKIIKMGDGVTPWVELGLPYLTTGGGTMTGALTLIAPTQPDHAARKTDVDAVDTELTGALTDVAETIPPFSLFDVKTTSTQINSAASTTPGTTHLTLNFPDPGGPIAIMATGWIKANNVSASAVTVSIDLSIDGDSPIEAGAETLVSSGGVGNPAISHGRRWTPTGPFTILFKVWGSSSNVQHLASGLTAIMVPVSA